MPLIPAPSSLPGTAMLGRRQALLKAGSQCIAPETLAPTTQKPQNGDVPGVVGMRALEAALDQIQRGARVPTAIVVCADGGGVAGIVESCMLEAIEAALGEPIGRRITLAAMNSAGGLALAPMVMNDPKSARQNRVDFQEKAEMAFHSNTWRTIKSANGWLSAKFSPEGLEQLMAESMGDRRISASTSDAIALTTTRDSKTVPLVVTSFKTGAGNDDYLWRDVVRASSAVPGLFPAATLKPIEGNGPGLSCWDGALWANNPTLAAFVFSRVLYPRAQRLVVISLGSGYVEEDSQKKVVSPNSGYIELAPELVRVFTSASTESAAYMMGIVAALAPTDVVYVRVNPTLQSKEDDPQHGVSTDWTDGRRANMDAFVYQMQKYNKEHPEVAEKIAAIMKTATPTAELRGNDHAELPSQQATAILDAAQYRGVTSRIMTAGPAQSGARDGVLGKLAALTGR